MALYTNTSHGGSSVENINIGRDPDDSARTILEMETLSDDSSQDRINVFVVFVFILDLLVLIFVAVLEFFLRFTRVFPVRDVTFSCTDPDISYSSETPTYRRFSYQADVSFEVIASLSFCIPPCVLIIGELSLWAFTEDDQKNVRVLCRECRMPQVGRRVCRYIGAFLFGLLVTMIFVDVLKIMVGRLRPTFLEVCKPPDTCNTSDLKDETICSTYTEDSWDLRQARLSFPSLQAAMTSFAGGYLAIYLHNTIRAHAVRIMRPFICLAFVMMSVLCCAARYGLYQNHFTDVLAGFLIGMALAIYIGVFVLNNFREYLSSKKLYLRLRNFFAEQRAMELRDLYKENWDRLERQSYFGIPAYQNTALDTNLYHGGGLSIPRPQQRQAHSHLPDHDGLPQVLINESSTDPMEFRDYHEYREAIRNKHDKNLRPQDTFQRDLQRTLDQYRGSDTDLVKGHI